MWASPSDLPPTKRNSDHEVHICLRPLATVPAPLPVFELRLCSALEALSEGLPGRGCGLNTRPFYWPSVRLRSPGGRSGFSPSCIGGPRLGLLCGLRRLVSTSAPSSLHLSQAFPRQISCPSDSVLVSASCKTQTCSGIGICRVDSIKNRDCVSLLLHLGPRIYKCKNNVNSYSQLFLGHHVQLLWTLSSATTDGNMRRSKTTDSWCHWSMVFHGVRFYRTSVIGEEAFGTSFIFSLLNTFATQIFTSKPCPAQRLQWLRHTDLQGIQMPSPLILKDFGQKMCMHVSLGAEQF